MSRPQDLPLRIILLSAVAYAGAFLLTTVLHELAHFVVALAWGRGPTLYHNSVQSQAEVSAAAQITTSLAGPVFSALQGLALLPVERRMRQSNPTARLLVVWLSFHGLMNATGYLFTTAFVPDADMGKAMRLLGAPMVGLIACSALGFWAIRVGARLIYPGFVALLPEDARGEVGARNRGLVRMALLAWPLGVAMVMPASLPVPHWLSLLYVVIAGIGAVWFTDFSKATPEGAPAIEGRALGAEGYGLGLWGLWLGLSALCVGVLSAGVSLS